MEWHYALNGQQIGPVSDAQLDALLGAGTINGDTLIWREGMAQWQALRTARPGAPPVAGSNPPAGGDRAVCAECRQDFPKSEMVFVSQAFVCARCKPVFLQRLREGAAPLAGQVWRSGKKLVLRSLTPLPDRCVRCNAPANGFRLKRQLYWHSSVIYLLILINLLVYIVVAVIIRKKARLDIGLCEQHRKERLWWIAGGWLAAILGVALFVSGISGSGWMVAAGLVVFFVGAVAGLFKGRVVAATKIDKEFAWVKGACSEYLTDFPEWTGPP